ncbi:MAG: hypothetical protein J6M25_06700 [Prevotella sp.]|nr:hypothetical protein [Prevotella sp.]
MKKIFICTFALLLSIVVFSSCESENETDMTVDDELSELQASLEKLNSEIAASLDVIPTRGPNDKDIDKQKKEKDTVTVVLTDAMGALEGAAAGSQILGSAGTFTIPVIGTVTGATLGGILGGIFVGAASSWVAWHSQDNPAIQGRMNLPMHEIDNVLTFENMTICFGRILDLHHFCDTTAIGPTEVQDIVNIAGIHNRMLDEMGNSQFTGCYTSIEPDTALYNTVKPLKAHYEGLKSTPFPYDIHSAVCKIFEYFYNSFSTCVKSKKEAKVIVERYLEYVNTCNEVTETERVNLLFAIATAWHSYNYWTKF